MNTYRIQYTRPYISNDSVHSEVILAQDEQQARDIFADCEVLSVELDKQDFDAEMESQKNAARIWTSNVHVTEDEMKAVHNYIVAAEAGDRAALAYGDADLTKRRDNLLYALNDEPCTREQADAAISELAELEAKVNGGVSSPAWWDAQQERSL